MIDRDTVAAMLLRYLNGGVTLTELVEWAEDTLSEGELEPEQAEAVSAALARLGLANVQAFSLTWEDAQALLGSLGYRVQVEVVIA